MATVDPQTIGGQDVGSRLSQALAPLDQIVAALSVTNNQLAQIHLEMRNTLGVQANTGTPARPPTPPPPSMPVGPQGAPGPTGTPTPIPRGGGVPPEPPPDGGSGGGGSGGDGGPSGPATPPYSGGYAGSAGSTGGDGLYDRIYNKVVSFSPLLGIPNAIRNEYQSQINKNNFYRGVTGADGQGEAFGMRIEEDLDRARYMRLWNKEENEQATRGLASMGLNSRNESVMTDRFTYREAKDFLYQTKDKYGATMEESLKLVDTASRQTSVNLEDLKDNLYALSLAAGDAGVSASKAREQFRQAWEVNMQMGGLSATQSANWAMATTAANTIAGPAFAQDQSYSRVATDTGYRATLAGMNNMTPGAMFTEMRVHGGDVANMQSGSFLEAMRRYLQPLDPGLWAWLENECQDAARDPSLVAQDYLDQWTSSVDPFTMVGVANQFRGTAENFETPDEVMRNVAKEMMGASTGAIMKANEAMAGPATMEGKSKADSTIKSLKNPIEDLDKPEGSTGGGSIGVGLHTGLVRGGPLGGGQKEDDDAGKATDWYLKDAKSKNERTPLLEGMLGKLSGKAEDDMKVSVETAKGRVVLSLNDALEQGYGDQIETGRAYFIGGEYKGKNLSGKNIGVFNKGVVATDEASITGARESSSSTAQGGTSQKDWLKEHPEDKWKAAGKRTGKGPQGQIVLSGAARKFFDLKWGNDPNEPQDNDNGFGANMRDSALDSLTFGASGTVDDLARVKDWLGL